MKLEKSFDKLFFDCHDYLFRGHELFDVYVPKNVISLVKNYKKVLLGELHLIKPLFKAIPDLEKSFKYKLWSKKFNQSYKLYEKTLKNPPKRIDRNQICMYKVLWESVHISNLLDDITKKANKNTIMEQALVAMCTAYECYVKDCFQWILNNSPEFAKKYISKLSIPIRETAEYNYEPLRNAGNIFVDKEGQYFAIFENAKKLYINILRFNIFKNKKDENKLWRIFQTRHCIIHNGGKPDSIWKRRMKNVKFKKDPVTLDSYIHFLHDQFHEFYARLYKHIFKRETTLVKKVLKEEKNMRQV